MLPRWRLWTNINIRYIWIIGLALGACATPARSATPSPASSATQTQISKTDTPVPTQTRIPTLTPSLTPTPDVLAALASEFNVATLCLFSNTYRLSKDRSWIGTACNFNRELILANKVTGNKIVVSYLEIDSEASTYFSVKPLGWSSDNRFFYFTTRCCEYEDKDNSNGSLYRFDTEDGSLHTWIRAAYQPLYFFSENGDRLIYLNHYPKDAQFSYPQHLEVGMIDLKTNQTKRIVFKDLWGPMHGGEPVAAWSKDGDRFGLIVFRPTFRSHEVQLHEAVLKVDFERMDMELVEKFDPNDPLVEE
jgi:hypothetical protein